MNNIETPAEFAARHTSAKGWKEATPPPVIDMPAAETLRAERREYLASVGEL